MAAWHLHLRNSCTPGAFVRGRTLLMRLLAARCLQLMIVIASSNEKHVDDEEPQNSGTGKFSMPV